MRKSFETIKPKRLHCLAHKFHLVVCNSLCLWVETSARTSDTEMKDEEEQDASEIATTSLNDLISEYLRRSKWKILLDLQEPYQWMSLAKQRMMK